MNKEQTETLIIELTGKTFRREVVESALPVLIDFWAPWCGPCRTMKPILDQSARLLAGRVRVAQVNVDEQNELAAAFGIQSIPTCILMHRDKILGSFVGVVPASGLVPAVLDTLSRGGSK